MDSDKDLDWDYLDENYKEAGNEVKDLEDYILDADISDDFNDAALLDTDNFTIRKTAEDVKNVRELMKEGVIVKDIASRLALEEEYVTRIAITLTSNTEDDNDIAIAHLVMMG